MSYNIDSIDTKSSTAWITPRDVSRLYREHNRNLAEICFLDTLRQKATEAMEEGQHDGRLMISRLQWSGEGSGTSWPLFLKEIAPHIRGHLECVVTWEGGDSVSGLIVTDGVVVECDVVQTLVPREKS